MDNLNDIQDVSLTQLVALTFASLIISHPELLIAKGEHHQYDVCLFCVITLKLNFFLEGQYYKR